MTTRRPELCGTAYNTNLVSEGEAYKGKIEALPYRFTIVVKRYPVKVLVP